MKHSLIFTVLFLCCFAVPSVHAQDEPEEAPARSRGGIVGAGGGVDGLWFFANTSVLNSELDAKGMPRLSENGMFMLGGHGYAYIIVVTNLRIGGMGAGGSLSETSVINGTLRKSELSTSFGGATIEYIFAFKRLHFAIGTLLGAGSNTITLTQGPAGQGTWAGSLSALRAEYTNSFFAWQPAATIEYDINPFTVLSLTGGYFGSSGDTWTLNEEFDPPDVPDLKLGSGFVRLRLTFGLFIGE